MCVLRALRTARAIAFGTAAIVILMAMTFAQGQEVQGAAPTAILQNLGGMAQGLAEWLPGGPPVITLHAIDGKGPKDFGKKGKILGHKFKIPLVAGQHSLTVSFVQYGYNNTFSTSDPVNLSFVAESGRTYTVECNVDQGSGRWIPFVVDRTDKSRPIIVLPPKTTSTNPSSAPVTPSAGSVATAQSGNDPSTASRSETTNAQPTAPSSPDKAEDDLFMSISTHELKLSTAARSYFYQGNYRAAVRFYTQARQVEKSQVWQSDYPLLAGPYFFLNDEADYQETLNEMMSKVTYGRVGYLHHEIPLGFLLHNLGTLRSKLPENQWPLIDRYIDTIKAWRDKLPD